MRLDQALVHFGYCESRSLAKRMIENGQVFLLKEGRRERLLKPSFVILEEQKEEIQVEMRGEGQYVSRGGLKLEGALNHLKFNVSDLQVLDIGISTGGFTDCLLQRGVHSVVGVDVGQGQLAPALQKEERIHLFEKVNARHLSENPEIIKFMESGFDLVVTDVSFISLELILSELVPYIKRGGALLALVKPQFELKRAQLNKKGVVKDPQDYLTIEEKLKKLCNALNLEVMDYFPSPIQGSDGNREFFIFAQRGEIP